MPLSFHFKHSGRFAASLGAVLVAAVLAFPANVTAEPASAGPLASQPQPVYPEGSPLREAQSDSPMETDSESASTGAESDADSDNAQVETDPANEPPASKVLVSVDKGLQEMTVFVDGVELYTWPVSTGLRGYSTPSGSFTASSMNKIWYSRQWDNAPMPHAIFFTKRGHAIHGTNETKRLGAPASKGCVRLAPKNAETLFKLVEEKGLKNTEVVLTGVSPGGEAKVASPTPRAQPRGPDAYPRWFDRYGYYEEPPRERRRAGRRRWFQPYYQAPPRQGQYQRRRFFRAPGY